MFQIKIQKNYVKIIMKIMLLVLYQNVFMFITQY